MMLKYFFILFYADVQAFPRTVFELKSPNLDNSYSYNEDNHMFIYFGGLFRIVID